MWGKLWGQISTIRFTTVIKNRGNPGVEYK